MAFLFTFSGLYHCAFETFAKTKKARIKNGILFNEELETNIQDLSQISLRGDLT